MAFLNIFKKKEQSPAEEKVLSDGLERSRTGILSKLSRIVAGRSKVDSDVLDSLEEMLITSDVGVETTLKIIESVEKRVAKDKYLDASELDVILREEITSLLVTHSEASEKAIELSGQTPYSKSADGDPYVVMVVGVNGVGKTTTIGKIAAKLSKEGKTVVIGAADTFRAAAIEQLEIWGERAGAKVIKQQMGSDPASVAYDAISSGKAQGADVVIIDTAGRLHNKVGLMNELTKIKNVMKKVVPTAPDKVMLVLDGSTGQNAFEQARQFSAATDVNSITITKLDGTARGGVVIGISDSMQVPVEFIGVGEGVDHLQVFDPKSFVNSLFEK